MHERGVVSAAAAAFLDEVGGHRVRSVTLITGPDMVVDIAADAWAHVIEGTAAGAATVDWEEALDLLSCFGCGTGYHGDKLSLCPRCGGSGLVVEPAPEFAVRDWEAMD
jgi:Zn finger protein HypA/HybF involved in hydrogenase expression